MRWFGALALGLAVLGATPAIAVQPDEMLANPQLEARARALSRELRCMVCQNQSIDDSNAALARDLRVLLRERLKAGDTDAEVFAFLTARYGEFVLLRPPFQEDTVLLWAGPLLILVVGGLGMWQFLRRRRTAPPVPPLSPEEQQRLDRLLDQGARS